MDVKDVLLLVGGGLSSPVLLKLLEYLKGKRAGTDASYTADAADRRAWIKELQDELRVLKACLKELEEENLKLERKLYKYQLNTHDRKAYERRVSEEGLDAGEKK